MNAAVVADTSKPPRYESFADPVAQPDEVLVAVRYAAQSSLAKAQAAGRHYSSHGDAAFVPGVDGVGTLEDGSRVYFAFPRAPFGSMAERVAVRRDRTIALPSEIEGVKAAAAGNPGMSSFAALTERAHLAAGESVLVNGATGVAGRLAAFAAKTLGAKHVIVTGRNRAVLDELLARGADSAISLDASHEDLTTAFRAAIAEYRFDVVLDYLWGPPALALIDAISGKGAPDGEPRIRYVQIGSSAGPAISMEAKTLRSSGIEITGSGLGSVSLVRLVAATAAFFDAFARGGFTIDTDLVPLTDVENTWNASGGSGRRVYAV